MFGRLPRWRAADSVAIVTGASSGIGRELCWLLLDAGCHVIAVARRQERLESLRQWTAETISDKAADKLLLVVGDVTEPSTCEQVLQLVDERFQGQLDLLVNNAGIGGIGPFTDASAERLRQIMEVNFFAPAMWIRHSMPKLRQLQRQAPVVCNIGSVLGHRAVPDKSEYCASKFALHGLSDSLRVELAGKRISVVLVSPSTTRSEFFDSLVGTDPGQQSRSVGSWPADRVARAAFWAISSRRGEVILSLGGKLLVAGDRLMPRLLDWVLSR